MYWIHCDWLFQMIGRNWPLHTLEAIQSFPVPKSPGSIVKYRANISESLLLKTPRRWHNKSVVSILLNTTCQGLISLLSSICKVIIFTLSDT